MTVTNATTTSYPVKANRAVHIESKEACDANFFENVGSVHLTGITNGELNRGVWCVSYTTTTTTNSDGPGGPGGTGGRRQTRPHDRPGGTGPQTPHTPRGPPPGPCPPRTLRTDGTLGPWSRTPSAVHD